MAKPVLLVTRKLPEAIEARAAQDYDALLNPQDAPWATDGAEIARRATEASAAGILGAAGDHFDSVCINALPPSMVTNTPEILSFATAECAFTLMLMAARRAGEGERMVRAGKWEGWAPTQLLGVTLERKKLGILGFGRIGRELASIARGFRMEIHYRDLDRLPPELEQGATYHDKDEDFLRTIDVLSMHVPGGEGTRKWLNAGRLATMKRGAIVVNTARGALVDDEALIAALKSGHIGAAGLDVYDGEPKVNPGYLTLENVTLLPHLGSATMETRDAMGHRALENLDAVLLKGTAAPDRVA
jgi:lactate dehydrogenase-like 2-hydroxyacid dehydrogenase